MPIQMPRNAIINSDLGPWGNEKAPEKIYFYP